jgi:type I restriction enzyme, S subunit
MAPFSQIVEPPQNPGRFTARIELIFEQKRERLQELKQSLLRKAFSGELTADRAEREVESATA